MGPLRHKYLPGSFQNCSNLHIPVLGYLSHHVPFLYSFSSPKSRDGQYSSPYLPWSFWNCGTPGSTISHLIYIPLSLSKMFNLRTCSPCISNLSLARAER